MNRKQDAEILELPDAHRFVTLSAGECHFRIDGPDDGPAVLLVHGATVPEWEFDRVRPYLLDAGFRTISPDLYGHGYSDRPLGRYDLSRFTQQLLELVNALRIDSPVRIVGHSLGAAVGARLAVEHPDRVDRLVLAAPMIDFIANAPWARILNVRTLGEAFSRYYVVPFLVRRRTRRYRAMGAGHFVAKFKNQLLKPGFDRALLALFRDGALTDQSATYQAVAAAEHPVLLIWGERDAVLPDAQRRRLRKLLPDAEHRSFADAEHSFLLTHPEQVAPVILDFLA